MNSKLFTKTDKSIGNSYILGCTFWETKKPNVFLTDYDIKTYESLKDKNIYLLFYSEGALYNQLYLSEDFLNRADESLINEIIEKIYKESIIFKLNKN